MTRQKERHPRQETAAQFASELKGTPFKHLTRDEVMTLAALCAAIGLIAVLMEGAMRSWQ